MKEFYKPRWIQELPFFFFFFFCCCFLGGGGGGGGGLIYDFCTHMTHIIEKESSKLFNEWPILKNWTGNAITTISNFDNLFFLVAISIEFTLVF